MTSLKRWRSEILQREKPGQKNLTERRRFNESLLSAGGEKTTKSVAILVWGPPGAGKSTLLDKYPPETIFKNTDDIVQFNCNPTSQQEYWACRKKNDTQQIDKYLNHLAIKQGKNLAIETTGNWYEPSWAADLKTQGFGKIRVMCVFVNLVDEIWRRIKNRDQLSVTYQGLLETYVNSYYKNMEKLLKDSNIDDVTIYDNSGEKLQVLATTEDDQSTTTSSLPKESQVYREWFTALPTN